MNPKITVSISVYNNYHLLKNALISLQKQNFKDFEVIIIDDKSNKIENFTQFNDLNIKFYKNKQNMGPDYCFNKAFKLATGKYFCTLDADDEFTKDSLDIRYSKLTSSKSDILHTGIYVKSKIIKNYISPVDTSNLTNLKKFLSKKQKRLGINLHTFMYKKDSFQNFPLRNTKDSFTNHNDYEFALRSLLKFTSITLDKPTYIYKLYKKNHKTLYDNDLLPILEKKYSKLI
jgi:glycosyltransferase involved in cell wall biosynthesis